MPGILISQFTELSTASIDDTVYLPVIQQDSPSVRYKNKKLNLFDLSAYIGGHAHPFPSKAIYLDPDFNNLNSGGFDAYGTAQTAYNAANIHQQASGGIMPIYVGVISASDFGGITLTDVDWNSNVHIIGLSPACSNIGSILVNNSVAGGYDFTINLDQVTVGDITFSGSISSDYTASLGILTDSSATISGSVTVVDISTTNTSSIFNILGELSIQNISMSGIPLILKDVTIEENIYCTSASFTAYNSNVDGELIIDSGSFILVDNCRINNLNIGDGGFIMTGKFIGGSLGDIIVNLSTTSNISWRGCNVGNWYDSGSSGLAMFIYYCTCDNEPPADSTGTWMVV